MRAKERPLLLSAAVHALWRKLEHIVGVNPNYRKSGIARALYDTFFEAVSNLGINTVQCVTSPVNKVSIAFHRSLGFSMKEDGKIIDGVSIFEGYDGEGEDRVLFYKVLNIKENE